MLKRAYHTLRFKLNLLRDLLGSFWAGFRRYRRSTRGEAGPLLLGFDGYPFLEHLTGVGWYARHLLECFDRIPNVRINLYARAFFPEEEGPGLVFHTDGLSHVRLRSHGVPPGILPNRRFWLRLGE